ncbi:MAG: class I SAM-dependent rRNA methyltransferase [Candidatus Omnitrophica bacterium]|nr:class I SAM-dependent rRNA methyltransferase [Candidatus Omnitrophota bacterium]
MNSLQALLIRAIRQRDKLSTITNAMRLVNGKGDGADGLLIDRFDKYIHIQVLKEDWHKHLDAICGILTRTCPIDFLIVKTRRGLDVTGRIFIGSDPKTFVTEHGNKFEVDLNDGLNCGLFLDMRQNRRLVAQACRGKKVLNCFAYTCSFGVYARAHGAGEVINTDISRKSLERGEKNYKLNALTVGEGEFVKADSISFLQRAFKKGNDFDMIILDPPSFARYGTKVFQVKRDLPQIIASAVTVLKPGGRLLVTTNYSEITHADLESFLAHGLKGRRVEHIQRVGQDEDFIGANGFKESYLVGLWVKFL